MHFVVVFKYNSSLSSKKKWRNNIEIEKGPTVALFIGSKE
jgi:hypothetical protein